MYNTQKILDNIDAGIKSGLKKADAKRYRCYVCGCKLANKDGYYGTGMCGPCYDIEFQFCESETLDDMEIG